MPKVLEANEIDYLGEEADLAMTLAEEQAANVSLRAASSAQRFSDLTDGGSVNGVRVTPMEDGRKVAKGRAVVRRAWMWNGSESMLPLAYDPSGKHHDGARHYLLKRHCLCCHTGGFMGRQCPRCVKNDCIKCNGSTDMGQRELPNGKIITGNIIPNFYLRKEDVPFSARFYGEVNCFLEFCPRRDGYGFQTQEEMIMHAGLRHKLEWQAYSQVRTNSQTNELQSLREQVMQLSRAQRQTTRRSTTTKTKS